MPLSPLAAAHAWHCNSVFVGLREIREAQETASGSRLDFLKASQRTAELRYLRYSHPAPYQENVVDLFLRSNQPPEKFLDV